MTAYNPKRPMAICMKCIHFDNRMCDNPKSDHYGHVVRHTHQQCRHVEFGPHPYDDVREIKP